jgi:thiamine-phosphate pyrophosphorylase
MWMSLEPRNRAQRKLIAAARKSAVHLSPALPPAFFVTDPARTPDPCAIAYGLPAGFGVIYRHFGAEDRESVAEKLARVCAERRLRLLIAADPNLAAQTGAAGVHWPYGMRRGARKWRARFDLQTVSAHSPRELRSAETFPVDGILLSTVFASRSASAGRAMGSLKCRLLVSKTGKMVYALGGITPDNAGVIAMTAGFAAVDGMRAFEKA